MCNDLKKINVDLCNTYNSDVLNEALMFGYRISKFFHSRRHILFEVKISFIDLNKKELTRFINWLIDFCELKKITIPSIVLNISKYNENVQYAIAYTILMGLSTWGYDEEYKI